MLFKLFRKDKDAILDYSIDWTKWLAGDTLSASTWTLSANSLIIEDESFTTVKATVWLSGGTVGETYNITNHITTDAGREDDRTISIRVTEK